MMCSVHVSLSILITVSSNFVPSCSGDIISLFFLKFKGGGDSYEISFYLDKGFIKNFSVVCSFLQDLRQFRYRKKPTTLVYNFSHAVIIINFVIGANDNCPLNAGKLQKIA